MLVANFFVSAVLVVLSFGVHFAGLAGLSVFMRRRGQHPSNLTSITGQAASVLFIVLTLFVLHAVEIWLYACVYLGLGALQDFETALYFSTSTFTTVGFGDVILDKTWRMLAAAESANGFLLIGWSTAFLVSVTGRVQVFAANVSDGGNP